MPHGVFASITTTKSRNSIQLVFAGETPVHTWWRHTMDAVATGALDPAPLISHRLPIADAPAGYAAFDRHEATKVVLDPWA